MRVWTGRDGRLAGEAPTDCERSDAEGSVFYGVAAAESRPGPVPGRSASLEGVCVFYVYNIHLRALELGTLVEYAESLQSCRVLPHLVEFNCRVHSSTNLVNHPANHPVNHQPLTSAAPPPPPAMEAQVRSRSGFALNTGIAPVVC